MNDGERGPTIASDAWVAPGAVVVGDVTLASEVNVWYGCVLRGDIAPITVGERTNIQDLTMVHVDTDRPCEIGADVGIGHRAIVHGCTIEDGCLIGMGAIVLSHCVIGEGSVIGAGAVVKEGTFIPPGSLVVGVPGRIVRQVDDLLRERTRTTVQHYLELAAAQREARP